MPKNENAKTLPSKIEIIDINYEEHIKKAWEFY